MRVLHVRNSDRLGGPERLILDQCVGASEGVSPSIASFGLAGAPHALLDEARRVGIETKLLEQEGSYDLRVVRRLREAIDRLAPDVVVGHDYKANLVLALAGRTRKRPRVAIVHGYTSEDRKVALFEAIDRRILKRVDAVVAVSASVRELLVASGVDPLRIHAIENGISVDRVAREAAEGRAALRAEWGLEDWAFAFLALGRLSPEKGQDVLVDAFAKAATRLGAKARLILVGDGATLEILEARVKGHVAAKRIQTSQVRFAGWRLDPSRCLGAADAFVLPSRREGLPLALLEAMAAGTPVIATSVGGVPEALDGGACGTLVAADDATALAEALIAVASKREGTMPATLLALSRVRERYGIARQTHALETVYSGLL